MYLRAVEPRTDFTMNVETVETCNSIFFFGTSDGYQIASVQLVQNYVNRVDNVLRVWRYAE
jgi:hypothetical protein